MSACSTSAYFDKPASPLLLPETQCHQRIRSGIQKQSAFCTFVCTAVSDRCARVGFHVSMSVVVVMGRIFLIWGWMCSLIDMLFAYLNIVIVGAELGIFWGKSPIQRWPDSRYSRHGTSFCLPQAQYSFFFIDHIQVIIFHLPHKSSSTVKRMVSRRNHCCWEGLQYDVCVKRPHAHNLL